MSIFARISGIALLLLLSLSLVAPASAQTTLVVTSASGSTALNGCDTDCTLFEAIAASDSTPALVDTITFNIPGGGVHTISTNSGFTIKKSVILDATTQPGYASNGGKPLIQISASTNNVPQGITVIDSSVSGFDSTLTVTIRGLAIGGFNGPGIALSNGQNHLIEQNFIGVDANGITAHPNDTGLTMRSPNSIIRNNVISGNSNTGLSLASSPVQSRFSINNQIVGNFIGTNFTGTAAIPNLDGIAVRSAANNNTIGGTSVADRNIISGNTHAGILTDGNDNISDFDTHNTTILGNYIGADVTGTLDLGNGSEGISIQGSDNNIIGGTTGITPDGSCTGACNLISGNLVGINISILNTSPVITTAENNLIQGNFIGTNASGTAAIENSNQGISIGSSLNTIGGTTPQARNLVSGNHTHGIMFSGSSAFGNVVMGNYIGTDTTGFNPLGNLDFGILIQGTAFGNQIGDGTDAGANWIGYNGEDPTNDGGGIGITEGQDSGFYTDENLITANSIFYNSGLGIDLLPIGVTLNDANDDDSGGNGLQNFPVLTSIVNRTDSTITGTLNSVPNRDYIIEFFGSTNCDESGYGEGEFYVGSAAVTTNGSGNASFNAPINPPIPGYAQVTAVAIENDSAINSPFVWNTSEFSACIAAHTDLSITKTDSVDPVLPGDNLSYTITVTNSNTASSSYADNTVVEDILPAGLTYSSATSTQGTCAYDVPTRLVRCDVGPVINGGSVTITLNTTVNLNVATGSISNTAAVMSDTPETTLSNNTVTQSTAIAQSNMRITMTDVPDPIALDALLTYTLNVTNLGPNPATNVSVTDTLPSNITFVGVTTTQGTCTPAVGTVNCSLGSIANGASAVIALIIRPNFGTQNTTISNTAVVSALQVDTVTANNTVTATTKVNVSTVGPMPNFFTIATPELSWTGVTWAVAYEIQVSANTSFIPVKFDDAFSPATLSIVTDPLPDGLWYWRVRAQNAAGAWAGWSPVMSFVVDTP